MTFMYNPVYFATKYRDARFLVLAMQELDASRIVIGNEISDMDLKIYDEKVHC